MPIDLCLTRGEEIHPPDNDVHMVNWGGDFSVNDLFRAPDYGAKLAAIERNLPDLGPGVDRRIYAAVVYCMRRIPGWASSVTPTGLPANVITSTRPW